MFKILRAISHPIQALQRAMDAVDRWDVRMSYQGSHWATA